MSGVGGETPAFQLVAPYWWVTNFGAIVANGIIAARSKKRITKITFALGATYHVVAAGYVYYTAREAGLDDDVWKWVLQTLAVGTPSVRLLTRMLQGQTVDGG
jgi:transmembrane protein TMEM254